MLLPVNMNKVSNSEKYSSLLRGTVTSTLPLGSDTNSPQESQIDPVTLTKNKYRNYEIGSKSGYSIQDPSTLGVDVLFKFGNNSPLFNLQEENPDSSLLGSGGSAYYYLLQIGEHDRAEALKNLVYHLNFLNATPYLLQGVTGLSTVWNRSSRLNFASPIDEETVLTCKYWDTIDLKLGLLIDLYQYITYDHIYHRQVLPDNLSKFSVDVFVYEIGKYSTYVPENDEFANRKETTLKEELLDFSSSVQAPSTDATTPITPILSAYKFTFMDCTLKLEGVFSDQIDNTTPKVNEVELKIVPSRFKDSSTLSVLNFESLIKETTTNGEFSSILSGGNAKTRFGKIMNTLGKSLLKTAIKQGKALLKDTVKNKIKQQGQKADLSKTHSLEYKNVFFEELEPKRSTSLIKGIIRQASGGLLGRKSSHSSPSHSYSSIIAEISMRTSNMGADRKNQLDSEYATLLSYMQTSTTKHKETVLSKIGGFAKNVLKTTLSDKKVQSSLMSHILGKR